jgi:hypothetical protein
LEFVAKGDPMDMGVTQGEALREKIRLSPGVLAQLHGFRAMQPKWLPYPLYRRVSESRATRFLEGSLKRDFHDAYLRMRGISEGSQTSMRIVHYL